MFMLSLLWKSVAFCIGVNQWGIYNGFFTVWSLFRLRIMVPLTSLWYWSPSVIVNLYVFFIISSIIVSHYVDFNYLIVFSVSFFMIFIIKLYADTVYQTVSSTEQTSEIMQITPSYCLSHTVPVESNVSYNKCVFKLDVVWQITIKSIYERYTRVSKVTVIENTTLIVNRYAIKVQFVK